MNKILDELPFWPVIIIATVFALMPFGEPHLWAKMMMLRDGAALAPIDWFDLLVHGGPVIIAALRVWRRMQVSGEASGASNASKDASDTDSES